MRTRTLLIPAVLLLAACSAPAEDPEPTTAPETVTEAEPTEDPTENPTTEATVDPTAPPEQCIADDNIGPVRKALEGAELPTTAMITDVDEFPPTDPSKDTTVVQVTVCSTPLNLDQTREVASIIATAAQAYDGPGIYRIDVQIQQANGPHLAEGRHVFVEDYGSIKWDRPPEETARFWTEV